jgi:hypothetical protein
VNAKDELLNLLKNQGVTLKCAIVQYGDHYSDAQNIFTLRCGFTPVEYDTFLTALDFNYDDGYGCQELFGTLWFSDGTWAERRVYDGSEWWERKVMPEILAVLL